MVFLSLIFKSVVVIVKTCTLNLIQSFLVYVFTLFFNKYPLLYKAMDDFFTILATFYSYLYSVAFIFHNKLKNNFPILYSITVYIYSEYLSIVNGDISRNMKVIIGLSVLFDCSKINLILYSLLILIGGLKKYLIKNTRLKYNYPILYRMLLDISSLITTILIIYFLNNMWLKVIQPLIKKNIEVLKMAGSGNNNNNQGNNPYKGNSNNNDPDPEGDKNIITKEEERKEKKRQIDKRFREKRSANETKEEKDARFDKQRDISKRSHEKRIANETKEEKIARLNKQRQNDKKSHEKRIANETKEERDARLEIKKQVNKRCYERKKAKAANKISEERVNETPVGRANESQTSEERVNETPRESIIISINDLLNPSI